MKNLKHSPILRPIHMDDLEAVINWSQDEDFCMANDWDLNRTPEELFNWWKKCVENKKSNFKRMGIELNGTLIGYGDLACINGSEAEVGIAIGESSLWGQGIGHAATILLINYGKSIGITSYLAETHLTNHRAQKLLERIGFRELSRDGFELYKGIETPLIQFELHI